MKCPEASVQIENLAQHRSRSLPDSIRQHLEKCAACRALWEFLSGGEPPAAVGAEVKNNIISSIVDSLEPVSPVPSVWKLTAVFVLVFSAISGFFVFVSGMRGGLAMGAVEFTTVIGLIGVAVMLLSSALSRQMIPGTRHLITPARMFLLVLVSLFLLVAMLFPWDVTGSVLPNLWQCFGMGLLFSFPAAGLILWLLRRGAILSSDIAGAGAGLLSGLVGMTVLHVGCNLHTAPHIVLAHLGLALATTLAGFLLGRYVPRLWSRG